MISAGDVGLILLLASGCAAVAGGLGLLGLRLTRRERVQARLAVLVATGVLATAGGVVAVAVAMYISRHDLAVLLVVAGSSAAGACVVALVLGRVLARDHTRLQGLARSLGEGRPVQAGTDPRDRSESAQLAAELAESSRRLAAAREEIAALEASRRELVAGISHDLRTPLAGMRAMTEALVDGMAPDPERYHRQLAARVGRLSAMVDDLFELSKIESGTLTLHREEVVLYDLVSDAVADLSAVGDGNRVRLREVGGAGVVVVGDPRELTRVVENLVANAIQYAPRGSEVVIETTRDGAGNAVLTVQDCGGIPADQIDRVFEPGWRATPSRSPGATLGRSGGAGLGLAIVRGIVEAHEGTVRVVSDEGGTTFAVTLPRLA